MEELEEEEEFKAEEYELEPSSLRHELPSSISGVYTGEFDDRGNRHGDGTCIYPNGDKYEGSYCDGLMHGKGKFTFNDGEVYEGDFNEGKCQGIGTYRFISGDKYTGQFESDFMHGMGTLQFADGECYQVDINAFVKILFHFHNAHFYIQHNNNHIAQRKLFRIYNKLPVFYLI